MKKINLDKMLRDQTHYKSLLLKIYKNNKEINREIGNFLEESEKEKKRREVRKINKKLTSMWMNLRIY